METLTDPVNAGDGQTQFRQVLDGDGLVLSSTFTLKQLSATALPAQTLYECDPAGRATKVATKNTVGGDIVTMSTYDQRGITTSVTAPGTLLRRR